MNVKKEKYGRGVEICITYSQRHSRRQTSRSQLSRPGKNVQVVHETRQLCLKNGDLPLVVMAVDSAITPYEAWSSLGQA